MATDLAKVAKERKIKYFLISYTDLFGALRAKLVPAAAIADMQKNGAGFAGFATWLDMTPAHPDLFAKPDPDSLIQLPWKPEVAWLASDLWMGGKPVGLFGKENELKPSIQVEKTLLGNLLVQARTMNPKLRTVIKGDKSAEYGVAEDVMELLQKTQITRFSLVTDLGSSVARE